MERFGVHPIKQKKIIFEEKGKINSYNTLVDSFINENERDVEAVLSSDSKNLSSSWILKEKFAKKIKGDFDPTKIIPSMYRPFTATWFYYDALFNENRYTLPRISPLGIEKNLFIAVAGVGSRISRVCY